MNRVETKKAIAEVLKESQGSHEFEKVAKAIMKVIDWGSLNRIKMGLSDVLGGLSQAKTGTPDDGGQDV